jgi:hypothetical protein
MNFSSNVTGKSDLTGSFSYDPSGPTLGSQYTLSSNPSNPVNIYNTRCNGTSIGFSIDVTNGGTTTTYNFNGAYTNGTQTIQGRCTYTGMLPGGDDPWNASATNK